MRRPVHRQIEHRNRTRRTRPRSAFFALPLTVAILLLCGATEARAIPITVSFSGILTQVSGYPASTLGLAVGDPFLATIVFRDDVSVDPSVSTMDVTMGSVIGPTVLCPVCRLDYTHLFAATFLYANGGPNFGGLLGTLFGITLNQGWQSGQFSIVLENAVMSSVVSGQITGAHVVHVPEPSTALMLGLGALAVVLRRQRQRRKAPDTAEHQRGSTFSVS
jgi:PEP-CTERM motif-containing protein